MSLWHGMTAPVPRQTHVNLMDIGTGHTDAVETTVGGHVWTCLSHMNHLCLVAGFLKSPSRSYMADACRAKMPLVEDHAYIVIDGVQNIGIFEGVL